MEDNMLLNNDASEVSSQETKPVGYVKKYILTSEQKKKQGISISSIIGKLLIYTFLVIFALWTLFPILLGFFLSVTPQSLYGTGEIIFIPKKIDFENYSTLLFPKGGIEMEKFYTNGIPKIIHAFFFTCLLILPPTIIGLFTSAMSAFAFAKLTFKGKNFMFGSLIFSMMIPGAISLVPTFAIYRTLIDDYKILWEAFPLFVPGMFGAAGAVFFLRQFFTGIPSDLMEAAKLDGMGYYAMFFKIIIPLSGAALIAQGIMGFVGGYNDYFGPLLYLANNPDLKTIQLILQAAKSLLADNPTVMLAAAMIALIPTLIIYIVAQRFFVEGIATSGMKL